jgi:hypothetical protein
MHSYPQLYPHPLLLIELSFFIWFSLFHLSPELIVIVVFIKFKYDGAIPMVYDGAIPGGR